MSITKKMNLWPEGERPCIWMEAGIVEFKLCDQQYDCDHCSFNAIMKNEHAAVRTSPPLPEPTVSNNGPFYSLQALQWDNNVYYGNRYWFVEPLGPQKALLGLNELALQIIPSLRDIILTEEGHVVKNQVIGWLLTDDGTICLKAPFDAKILKSNPAFLSDAQERNPKVWMFTLSCEHLESELNKLRKGQAAATLLNTQRDSIISQMRDELNAMHPAIEETMQDGGQRVDNLEQMLGCKRYLKVISRFFENLPTEPA